MSTSSLKACRLFLAPARNDVHRVYAAKWRARSYEYEIPQPEFHVSRAPSLPEPLSIVVRSAGERTAVPVEQLLCQHSHQVFQAAGQPFEETLRKAYQFGRDVQAEWTIMLDGDVIPLLSALEGLRDEAKTYAPNVLGSSAKTFDQLLGRCRYVGVRVFRTELLPELESNIPSPGRQIRPETYAHRMLEASSAWKHVKSQVICGLHGFEQYLVDVFATSFTLAQKPELQSEFLRRVVLANQNDDLQIARIGAAMSLASKIEARVDRRQLRNITIAIFESLGIAEKPEACKLPSQNVILQTINLASAPQTQSSRRIPYRIKRLLARLRT